MADLRSELKHSKLGAEWLSADDAASNNQLPVRENRTVGTVQEK
jgi:hypothetical protein